MVICLFFFLIQWQQQVSYKINAYLDTEENSLRGVEYLTYHNNSPYSLETLYVHLYANAYRDLNTTYAQESKKLGSYGDRKFLKAKESERGYINIEDVTQNDKSLKFKISETIMTIFLNDPVKSGDSIELKLDFYLKIPKQFSRLGYKNKHYEIVQWYPKICVFDEPRPSQEGRGEARWHRDSYHALGEFYGEYGCFDVGINLPGNYVVAATGKRTDKADREFIDSLITSGKKIDVGERKTVRFYAENVHDFAWVCDADFMIKKYVADSINIFVYYLKKNKKSWENAGAYAVDALRKYNQWYGTYPYQNLSVVNGFHPAGGGMEYPNLVIISSCEDWLTRLFEETIIHEIGHQWFYGILGSNEMDETWLDEGFTTYTEIRYFEDKYGKDNSLIKSSLIPPLSIRYYHKLYYYITQTNQLEKPILTPAYEFIDVPIAYINSAYAKPAFFLFYLEGIMGKEKFAKIIKRYVQEYKFKHPKTEDFIRICEEESKQDLEPLFSQFLNTTDFCDWSVKKVSGNRVEIENKGNLHMPVDVFVKTESEANTFKIDTQKKIHTIVLPDESGKIKKVTIDPHDYILESNRWNNHYPREFRIKPILYWPSFEAYQILYLPYLWYSSYDGITVGAYLFGSEFADFDFVKGKHQWTAGCTYGFKSKKVYPGFSYQTPIIFKHGMRARIIIKGSNSSDEYKLGLGLINNFSIPFSQSPKIELSNMFSYYELNSYNSVDSIDWNYGRNIVLENHFAYQYLKWNIEIGLSFSNKFLGSEWDYLKTTFEIKKEIETFIPFNIRFFAGRIFGTAPNQDKFFLNGALRITPLADLLFGQKEYTSPQEHIHIFGDGNMLGYQTMHIKSDKMYCVNLELPSKFPIRIFADFGYYGSPRSSLMGAGEYAVDFGAKIVWGPVSLNFPIYTKTDEPWELRWSIGL